VSLNNSKVKVLYIEDDTVQRHVIFHVLKRHGFIVQTALDGQGGVALAQSWQPDLILMDLMLPIMDGYQAAQALREHPDTEHIPIVAYSAVTDKDVEARVQAVGMNGLLPKTTSPRELVQRLESYLSSECPKP